MAKKICLVSASGGHFEQLCRLKPLLEKYDGFVVTEKTDFKSKADYYVTQTGLGEKGLMEIRNYIENIIVPSEFISFFQSHLSKTLALPNGICP